MRSFKKGRYFYVFIISVAIFFFGFLMGFAVNTKKTEIIETMAKEQGLNTLSMQLQFTYLNYLNMSRKTNCETIKIALDENWKKLCEAYAKFVKYKDAKDSPKKEMKLLERNRLLNELRYWFLLKEAKIHCDFNNSVWVLYFFSEKLCKAKCERESAMLEYFKKLFGDRFLLFYINMDIEEPFIKMIYKEYNITEYPTIVVEGEKFGGEHSFEELKSIICSKFKNKQPECE